jgi:putative membrane protein
MPDDEGNETPDPQLRDPDARFLLANERTLLAWLRTALAMLAGGVGITQFLSDVPMNGIVGLGLLAIGAISLLVGLQRYRSADAAMRSNLLPPKGVSLEILTLILFVLAAAMVVILITHRATTI